MGRDSFFFSLLFSPLFFSLFSLLFPDRGFKETGISRAMQHVVLQQGVSSSASAPKRTPQYSMGHKIVPYWTP